MSDHKETGSEAARMNRNIGHVLRVGVLVSGSIVLLGAILYLLHQGGNITNYKVFHPQPHTLNNVHAFVEGIATLRGRAIIQLGLLLLIATPVAYVALALNGFRRQRDWRYVGVSATVLAILLFSLLFVR